MEHLFTIRAAQPEELRAAFHLFFRKLPHDEQSRRVERGLRLIREGEYRPDSVWLAVAGKVIAGVLIAQALPGASAILWPPVVQELSEEDRLADALVRHAKTVLRRQGTRVAHALLTEDELKDAEALVRNGFSRVTRLWYLRHDLQSVPSWESSLTFRACLECDPELFQQTLMRTYVGSLDCPELNGVRSAEEILAGHRAQGQHNPSRWWLACSGREPVGVLLLSDVPSLGGWELAYLGIVPEARGRGLGLALGFKALAEAARGNAPHLTLAVDERNQPAWNLYRGLGFTPFDARELLLSVWEVSCVSAANRG